VVLLVLLSDCAPGCGGTALLPGSHLSVLAELEASDARRKRAAAACPSRRGSAPSAACPDAPSEPAEPAVGNGLDPGPEVALEEGDEGESEAAWSHQALNTAFVQRLRALTEAGRVQLDCSACRGRHPHCQGKAAAGLPPVRVAQVAGRAGDVVLLHPLLLHSGTMNCGRAPRCLLLLLLYMPPLLHKITKGLLVACQLGALFFRSTVDTGRVTFVSSLLVWRGRLVCSARVFGCSILQDLWPTAWRACARKRFSTAAPPLRPSRRLKKARPLQPLPLPVPLSLFPCPCPPA
jgi:hypothetical protein